ncbi:hypothetical protein D9758_015902 [Tetrapyrgos nigripes]|uniref:Uncharacterized protein n=1 Tax=Tetrapyrgos nigripes TaxID=182062 RepID=A0A8H5CMZ1_9AGAR|nr:hypothetical protein D9758_015902 [Tetrapyrgos nigripes]
MFAETGEEVVGKGGTGTAPVGTRKLRETAARVKVVVVWKEIVTAQLSVIADYVSLSNAPFSICSITPSTPFPPSHPFGLLHFCPHNPPASARHSFPMADEINMYGTKMAENRKTGDILGYDCIVWEVWVLNNEQASNRRVRIGKCWKLVEAYLIARIIAFLSAQPQDPFSSYRSPLFPTPSLSQRRVSIPTHRPIWFFSGTDLGVLITLNSWVVSKERFWVDNEKECKVDESGGYDRRVSSSAVLPV